MCKRELGKKIQRSMGESKGTCRPLPASHARGCILQAMSMQHYTKMSGAGNTFIMMDGRALPDGVDLVRLAQQACDATLEHGGADGFIAVDSADGADDFVMRYYNRDGSTGMMCGNGGRCAVRFAADHGLVPHPDNIRFTNAGVPYQAAITGLGVRVGFPDPRRFVLNRTLAVNGGELRYHFADVGTPHAILFVDEAGLAAHVSDVDVAALGAAVRNHPDFAPDGANANFVEVRPNGQGIILRTFERGVEAETGACGTGAISCAIVAAMRYGLAAPVTVTTSSGAELRVDFRFGDEGGVTDVWLEGGADVMIEGEIELGG